VELRQLADGCQSVDNGAREGRVGTSDVGTTVTHWLPGRYPSLR
jgi:hypothetical protein